MESQDLLAYMNASELVDITLELMARVWFQDMIDTFYQFVDASRFQLQNLTIVHSWPPSSAQVLALVTRLPTLQVLRFIEGSESEADHHNPCFNVDVFEALTLNVSGVTPNSLLPCLRELEIGPQATYPMTMDAAVAAMDFMDSRVDFGLKKVTMDMDIQGSTGVIGERRSQLHSRGLDVSGINLWRF
jgi:hypothetical protein